MKDKLYNKIISKLLADEEETVMSDIFCYLYETNNQDYKFLLVNLFKICVIYGDKTFYSVISILTQMQNNTFVFDIKIYEKLFKTSYRNRDYEASLIYIKILRGAVSLGFECEKLSEYTEKLYNKINRNLENEHYDELISSKKNELIENGIVLLDPMGYWEREKVIEASKRTDDVIAYFLREGEEKRIYLRYAPFLKDKLCIDKNKLMQDGSKAYDMGEYEKCIRLFKKLMSFPFVPYFVFSYIGYSYYKLGREELAINYLKIATDKAKKDGKDYDFLESLKVIKQNTLKREK